MPDKPATVAAYAAGASLVAIATFYVFGPTFFIDGEHSNNTSDGRKRTIIGLHNPANDCFINSVLQALAGLGDLRVFLIREVHQRKLDGLAVYESLPDPLPKGQKPDRLVGLQIGLVTKALKDMLDALNERPIYRKTISSRPMIEALERAFQTRISRSQQDAQEFLQIVLERLCDEYHAGEKARKRMDILRIDQVEDENQSTTQPDGTPNIVAMSEAVVGNDDGFPFEGRIESQIQCQFCGFRTKPSVSAFVSLTLNVPQKSSTSLDNCFDILLKSEEIDDFKCDKCRLRHALEWKQIKLGQETDTEEQDHLRDDISAIEKALEQDPEQPPKGVELPDSSQAPKRKIRKHTRITVFPKVIAVHLSRSVFDPGSSSTKNQAKVQYTQRLRLGGILNEKWYKLLGVVCHKGSHNSGHYESFRRNHVYPPFATVDAFSAYASASRANSRPSTAQASPNPSSSDIPLSKVSTGGSNHTSTPPITPMTLPTGLSETPSRELGASVTSDSTLKVPERPELVRARIHRTNTEVSKPQIQSHEASKKFGRRKKASDRWWRISDDKIKEASMSDVLSMQREVYLLFYELERPSEKDNS